MSDEVVLTAADPQPPAGTIVIDDTGCRWIRQAGREPCGWISEHDTNAVDPESWTKVAGNYGPVRVLSTPPHPARYELGFGSDGSIIEVSVIGERPQSPREAVTSGAKPAGIQAFDLVAPLNVLVAAASPLRSSPETRARAHREAEERRARVAREHADAYAEWQTYADRFASNPVAAAGFALHKPTAGHDRVECSECREEDYDSTVGAVWPCGTYAAMKAAADG